MPEYAVDLSLGEYSALAGFVARTAPGAMTCYAVEDCESLEAAMEAVRA